MIVEHLVENSAVYPLDGHRKTHVIALSLVPVQWLLSALVTFGKIAGAPDGNLWLLDGSIGGRTSDLASETVHEHCEQDEETFARRRLRVN